MMDEEEMEREGKEGGMEQNMKKGKRKEGGEGDVIISLSHSLSSSRL